MKLTLDHTQRLNLHALLGAQRADVGSIRAIWALQDKIALDAQEEKTIGVKRDITNGMERVVWNPTVSISDVGFIRHWCRPPVAGTTARCSVLSHHRGRLERWRHLRASDCDVSSFGSADGTWISWKIPTFRRSPILVHCFQTAGSASGAAVRMSVIGMRHSSGSRASAMPSLLATTLARMESGGSILGVLWSMAQSWTRMLQAGSILGSECSRWMPSGLRRTT